MSDVDEPPVWHIDPDTLQLTGGPSMLTSDQWSRQAWPPCPVCGAELDIDRIDVSSMRSPTPVNFIVGRWACPNGCDPRRADPRRA